MLFLISFLTVFSLINNLQAHVRNPFAPAPSREMVSSAENEWELRAILQSSDRRYALIFDGQKTFTCALGEPIGNYVVTELDNTKVVLSNNNKKQMLSLNANK